MWNSAHFRGDHTPGISNGIGRVSIGFARNFRLALFGFALCGGILAPGAPLVSPQAAVILKNTHQIYRRIEKGDIS